MYKVGAWGEILNRVGPNKLSAKSQKNILPVQQMNDCCANIKGHPSPARVNKVRIECLSTSGWVGA